MTTSRDAPLLSARQDRVLFALCREYVVTGRPVASSSLCRAAGLRWSSATIRSDLVALEELGFVFQPHQSAGRIPTARGLGHYIRGLPRASEPPADLRRAVDLSLAEGVRSEGLRTAARLLSDVVGCVAVAFVGEPRRGVMRRLDLRAVHGARALVAVTLDDGTHTTQPVVLDSRLFEGADGVALGHLEARLRALCVDRTLGEARVHLGRLLADQEARLDRFLAEALRVGLWICTVASLDPLWLQVAGQRMLAAQAPPFGVEILGQILGLLEDYHQLAEVLCQLLPLSTLDAPRVEVRTGSELAVALVGELEPALGLSLVGCRVPPAGHERTGAVALLGPDRMDYEAAIPLVEYAARALASRPA